MNITDKVVSDDPILARVQYDEQEHSPLRSSKKMSKKEREQMHRDSAAILRDQNVRIAPPPSNPNKRSMKEIMERFKTNALPQNGPLPPNDNTTPVDQSDNDDRPSKQPPTPPYSSSAPSSPIGFTKTSSSLENPPDDTKKNQLSSSIQFTGSEPSDDELEIVGGPYNSNKPKANSKNVKTLQREDSGFHKAGHANTFSTINPSSVRHIDHAAMNDHLLQKASVQLDEETVKRRQDWEARGGRERKDPPPTVLESNSSPPKKPAKLDSDEDEGDDDYEPPDEEDEEKEEEEEEEEEEEGDDDIEDDNERQDEEPEQPEQPFEKEPTSAQIQSDAVQDDQDEEAVPDDLQVDNESDKENQSPDNFDRITPNSPDKTQTKDSAEVPAGFSQFFDDGFSQEVGGEKFMQSGFKQNEKLKGTQLLPQKDLLPNISLAPDANDDMELMEASFMDNNQESPRSAATQINQYINAKGMFTQTEPTEFFDSFPDSPTAGDPDSPFNSVRKSQFGNSTANTQQSPTSQKQRRLIRGEKTFSGISTTQEELSPTQLEKLSGIDSSLANVESSNSTLMIKKDAFAMLKDGAKSLDNNDQPENEKSKKKGKNIYVADKADESEDEDEYRLGARKEQNPDDADDDMDDDDDDDLGSVSDLVDDEEVSAEKKVQQDALAEELLRKHEKEDDERVQKLHQDAAAGQLRKKRQGSFDVMSDSEYEDDDKHGNAREAKKRRKKRAALGGKLGEIAKNPATQAFADVIANDNDDKADDDWLHETTNIRGENPNRDDDDDDELDSESDKEIALDELGEESDEVDEETQRKFDEEELDQHFQNSSSPIKSRIPRGNVPTKKRNGITRKDVPEFDIDLEYGVMEEKEINLKRRWNAVENEHFDGRAGNRFNTGKGTAVTGHNRNTKRVQPAQSDMNKKTTSNGDRKPTNDDGLSQSTSRPSSRLSRLSSLGRSFR